MVNSSDLIKDFVNTWDILESTDELGSPAALVSWCAERGLVARRARATAADLREALALREALRAILLAHNGVEVELAGPTAILDGAARRAGIELRFGAAGPELVSRSAGIAGALGKIAAAVHVAINDGSWERLKACRADDCLWVFVDSAKNRSRAWCSMSECGNRAKARSFRDRHRAAST
jgi:predicted RNA-binding Zn ribbon-like protein